MGGDGEFFFCKCEGCWLWCRSGLVMEGGLEVCVGADELGKGCGGALKNRSSS